MAKQSPPMNLSSASAQPTHVVQLGEMLNADPAGDGVHWSLDAASDLNVNLAHLDTDSRVAPHTNPELDVVIIVLAGTGTLRLDGTDHDLAPHILALAAKGTERSITAGPSGLTYLTVHRRRGPLGITSSPASSPAS